MSDRAKYLMQVAPGVFVDPLIRMEVGPGKQNWMLMNNAGFKALGLSRGQYNTLRRLWEAGFISMSAISPNLFMLDLDSWNAHRARCSEDPYYWDREGPNSRRLRDVANRWKELGGAKV